jgi:hypothetical protein
MTESASPDLCSNCMNLEQQRNAANESSRHNGDMYEQAKRRWYEASDALTRVKDLCDSADGPVISVADVREAARIRPLPAKERNE